MSEVRIVDIRPGILLLTPFSDSELSEDIMKKSVQYGLEMFNTKIINVVNGSIDSLESKYGKKYRIITSNNSGFSDCSFDYDIMDLRSNNANQVHEGYRGLMFDASVPWDLTSIYNHPNEYYKSLFEELVAGKAMMLMANKRRSVEMSSLPFDLKGETFYSQGDEMCKSAITKLSNLSQNFY